MSFETDLEATIGVSQAEVSRRISIVARQACRKYNLDYSQYGQDCEQEVWLYLWRKVIPKYDPERDSQFMTMAFQWMTERANRYARHVKDRHINVMAEYQDVHTVDSVDRWIEQEDAIARLKQVDPLIVGREAGLTDAELAEQFEMSPSRLVSTRRKAARDLRGA